MSVPHVTEAIVLRAVAYGEADRVVTLLGRDTGRVSAIARGARKSLRRFGGGLGLGARGTAIMRERPGIELMTFESFDAVEPRFGLAQDLGRTAHAAYALELCDRLCAPRQAEVEVYRWVDEFLARLEAGGARAERLRVFELGLLSRLGLGPELSVCVSCGRGDLGDEMARWQPDRGGLVCQNCARVGALFPAATRAALGWLAGLSLADADAATLARDLNAACRQLVLELVRHHVPGPLRSVDFIAKLGGPTS